jgi:hypothetical protein
MGLSVKEVAKKYFEVFGRPINEKTLTKDVLPTLEGCGLIYRETDPKDKRRMLIFCEPVIGNHHLFTPHPQPVFFASEQAGERK